MVISRHNMAFKEVLALILELSYLMSFAFWRYLNIRRALNANRRILIMINISLALGRLPSYSHFEAN